MPKERPEVLAGETIRAKTEYGYLYLTINCFKGEAFEVRIQLGKSGNFVRSLLEHIGIMYSILLQSDLPKAEIIRILEKHCVGVSDNNPFFYKGISYKSCIDFIARKVLEKLKDVQDGEKAQRA